MGGAGPRATALTGQVSPERGAPAETQKAREENQKIQKVLSFRCAWEFCVVSEMNNQFMR